MGNFLKDMVGVVSPAYGALTGNGVFGNLLGKQSESEHAADIAKAAADSEAQQQKQAQQQQQNMAVLRSQGMKKGGKVTKMSSGGKTNSASRRADGIATKGKTRGRMV